MTPAVRLGLIGAAGAIVCFAIGTWWRGTETGLIFLAGFAAYFLVVEALLPYWYARTARRLLRDALAPGTPPPSSESGYRVIVGATDISVVSPDASGGRIAIDDLQDIRILTTDAGPWCADVWWLLADSAGRCACPLGADGTDALLQFAQSLPGFDTEAFVTAMGSTRNAEFLCWRRASVPAAP